VLDDVELDDVELESCTLELEDERLLSLSLLPPQAVKPAVSASISINSGEWCIGVLRDKVAASVSSLCYRFVMLPSALKNPAFTLLWARAVCLWVTQ